MKRTYAWIAGIACLLVLMLCASASGTTLKYLGQACFLITADNGLRIVIDPFASDGVIHYKTLPVEADVVFVSHEHFDHNAVDRVKGDPVVVRPMTGREIRSTTVKTRKGVVRYEDIPSWHDTVHGAQRGPNTIRVITVDGVNICHFGDLGYVLPEAQIRGMHADIWLIPVGGKFTIDAQDVEKMMAEAPKSSQPFVIIPMHYKTDQVDIPLAPVDKFLAGKKNVERLKGNTYIFSKDKLPHARKVVVLSP